MFTQVVTRWIPRWLRRRFLRKVTTVTTIYPKHTYIHGIKKGEFKEGGGYWLPVVTGTLCAEGKQP